MVLDFFMSILSKWSPDTRIVVMVVIQSAGDSPGRSGFMMTVGEDGEMSGTIGGGIMEHKLVELSKSLLSGESFQPFAKRQIHKADIGFDRSGMICDGEQTIAFYYIHLSQSDVIPQILSGEYTSVLFSNKGIRCVNQNADNDIDPELSYWNFFVHIKSANKLVIFGAGHVSLALCQILSNLDFEIFLYDDRPSLNTLAANSFIHHKQIIDYDRADLYLPKEGNVYVVLITFGYRSDEIILKTIYGMDFYYTGMMGSPNKIETMRLKFIDEGYDISWFDKINAPIGIEIKSKTSYEIAISIAAQLIEFKNKE